MIHYWGEEDFDWKSLGEAINFMHKYMLRWGRLGVHSKEKYGTARLYMYFYPGGLFSLFYPGYVSYYPWFSKKFIGKYLMWLEYNVFQPVTENLKIYKPIQWWQRKVYNKAYEKAVKLYPNVAEEIVEDADYPEMIDCWHKVMADHWRRSNKLLEKRWLETAEFYRRAIELVPESEAKIKIINDYAEFDSL